MPEFLVTWEIDIEADTAEKAAREALRIQRDPASIATVFTVRLNMNGAEPERVDLEEVLGAENSYDCTDPANPAWADCAYGITADEDED